MATGLRIHRYVFPGVSLTRKHISLRLVTVSKPVTQIHRDLT